MNDRPWWASDPAQQSSTEDPVTAHRAARRGSSGDDPWWDAVGAPPSDDPTARPGPHTFEACGICPICAGLRALSETRPDLVHHLAEAARHVAAAVRAALEAPPTSGGTSDEPLEHIDLDE